MTAPVAGIDPHQDSFTVGIADPNGVEIHVEAFTNTGCGYASAIDLLLTHGVERVGVEGSASWGSHIAVAVTASGFDARRWLTAETKDPVVAVSPLSGRMP